MKIVAVEFTIQKHLLLNLLKLNEQMKYPVFLNIETEILKHINEAQHSIYAAIAWISNEEIIMAILDAAHRGVNVELIICDDSLNTYFRERLSEHYGYTHKNLYVYMNYKKEGFMHNKFSVFDKRHVITGSYNWTESASNKNDENILVIKDDEGIATKYLNNFSEIVLKSTMRYPDIYNSSGQLREYLQFQYKKYKEKFKTALPFRNEFRQWGLIDQNADFIITPFADSVSLWENDRMFLFFGNSIILITLNQGIDRHTYFKFRIYLAHNNYLIIHSFPKDEYYLINSILKPRKLSNLMKHFEISPYPYGKFPAFNNEYLLRKMYNNDEFLYRRYAFYSNRNPGYHYKILDSPFDSLNWPSNCLCIYTFFFDEAKPHLNYFSDFGKEDVYYSEIRDVFVFGGLYYLDAEILNKMNNIILNKFFKKIEFDVYSTSETIINNGLFECCFNNGIEPYPFSDFRGNDNNDIEFSTFVNGYASFRKFYRIPYNELDFKELSLLFDIELAVVQNIQYMDYCGYGIYSGIDHEEIFPAVARRIIDMKDNLFIVERIKSKALVIDLKGEVLYKHENTNIRILNQNMLVEYFNFEWEKYYIKNTVTGNEQFTYDWLNVRRIFSKDGRVIFENSKEDLCYIKEHDLGYLLVINYPHNYHFIDFDGEMYY